MYYENDGYYLFYVYIITNKYRSALYIGMTDNLPRRLKEHRENIDNGTKTFASRYNIQFLVYYEKYTWVQNAIMREKQLKKWNRDKKFELIRQFNPEFKFLNDSFKSYGG